MLRMDMDWKNWANLVKLPRKILYLVGPKEIMICLTSSWFYRSIFCMGQRTSKPYVALRQLVTAVWSKVLGRLSNDDSDVNENGKKAIGYFEKQQSCTCITLFYTFLCRHCTPTTWKCLISRFVGDVNTTRRLSFCFLELRYNRLKFNSRTNCASFEEMYEKEYSRKSLRRRDRRRCRRRRRCC